jgi:hypothetical protein
MARKSTIDRLSGEVRELIGDLREGGCTIDQILAKLQELKPDVTIARSTLGRHIQEYDALGKELAKSRQAAEALAAQLGDSGAGSVARLNIEIGHVLLQKLMFADGQLTFLEPQEVMMVMKAIQSLASAAKTDADHRAAVKKELAAEHVADLEAAAAKGTGMNQAMISELKSKWLGLRPT